MIFAVSETITEDALSGVTAVHDLFKLTGVTLNATSTPAITKASVKTYTLTAGAVTIDLEALQGIQDVAVNAVGLKPQVIIIKNPAGNNTMTLSEGASNGYALNGGNDIVLTGHATVDTFAMFFIPEGLPDVAGADSEIDIAGTGTESISIGMVFG